MYFIVNPLGRIHNLNYKERKLDILSEPGWYVEDTVTGGVSYMSSDTIMALPEELVIFHRPRFDTTQDMEGMVDSFYIGKNVVKHFMRNTFTIGGKTWELRDDIGCVFLNDILLAESPSLFLVTRLSYIYIDGHHVLVRVIVRAGANRNWLSLVFLEDGTLDDVSILSGTWLTLRWHNNSVYMARRLLAGLKFEY